MSCVILLGAGASRGILGEQAPVAKDFGQYLNKLVPSWSQNYPYLAAAICFLEQRIPDTSEKSWALDKVWSAIDNRVKLRYIWDLNLPGAPFRPPNNKNIYKIGLDPWGLAGFELLCAVAHVYGKALDSKIQEATKGNGTVKMKIEKLQQGDCVISFNYDLLTERILENLKKKVTIANSWFGAREVNNTILLCKPHGSLSWQGDFPEIGRCVRILNDPVAEKENDYDFAQRTTTHAAIVAPVPFKSEIIGSALQLNKVPNFFHLLVAQWRWAIQRISEAEKLIVLGYGFPPEDLHAHYLFAEAAANRKSNNELKIEVYEGSEQRFDNVKKEIDKLFKPISCKYLGPVIP
jgi:hypothetical protein